MDFPDRHLRLPARPAARYQQHLTTANSGDTSFGQTLSEYRAAQWLEDNIPTSAITARFDCTSTLARAVSEGVGIGLLPCFVGDRISSLRAFAKIDGGLPIDIWLVTAAANRKRDNVKSFFKFFAASLRAQKALFKGAPYNS